MKYSTNEIPGEEWLDYYSAFPSISRISIRKRCYPWKMVHKDSRRSIVLVHGLSDSPFFMLDLASFFFNHLGYSVFLPLLQGHGLSGPDGMAGVSRHEWKKNVGYAIETAGRHGEVSIGGLSTGATLGLYAYEKMGMQEGCLYLFSTALSLSGWPGFFKEYFLRSFCVDACRFISTRKPMIGEHPYRYAYVEMAAARELAFLMEEMRYILGGYSQVTPFPHWVFAAHCIDDPVVSYQAVEKFQQISTREKFMLWSIDGKNEVSHAGLVLRNDIVSLAAGGRVVEKGNPYFPLLLKKIEEMEKKRHGM